MKIIYLFLAAAAFTVLLITLYPFRQKYSYPNALPTPTPTPIIEKWQTYRNDQYGFEFQYPDKYKFNGNYMFDEKGNNVYTLVIEENPKNLNFEKFEISKPSSPFVEIKALSPETTKKILPNIGDVYFRMNAPYTVDIDISGWIRNGKIFYFSKFSENNNFEEYNQILSTFKFFTPTKGTAL